jgi:hypothetical protein
MKLHRVEQTTDHLTGEITQRTSNVIDISRMPPEPDYIKLYVEDVGAMHGLTPAHRAVLLHVAIASGYDGIATISTRRKAAIALAIGSTTKTVANALTECIKAKLLRRIAHSEYEPTPLLFGKGEWSKIRERRQRFVATFCYGPEGRTAMGARTLSQDEQTRLELEQRGQQRLEV